MSEYLPEGKLILTQDNINTLHSFSLLSDAKKEGKILEARACVCDAEHNLIVDLGIMKGIIPREEGAIGIREGTVRDIAVISRVNLYVLSSPTLPLMKTENALQFFQEKRHNNAV